MSSTPRFYDASRTPMDPSHVMTSAGAPANPYGTLEPPEGAIPARKICGVCGDRAKSFHFGGLSCDSCKAFFRRSVQNDAYRNFQCSYDGHCVITLSTRKSCQFCRLQRCFAIGMEKSWVMTEQERLQMMKARAEKKLRLQQQQQQQQQHQQQHQQHQQQHQQEDQQKKEEEKSKQQTSQTGYDPDLSTIGLFLKPDELKEIEGVVLKYMQSYQQVPYETELKENDEERPGVQVINMFTTLIRRFAFFSRLLPQFAVLLHHDQAILLRGGTLEMCLLRGALAFDPTSNRWPDTSYALYHDAPVLRMEDARKLVSHRLFDMHMEFIACVQRMHVDEPTIMLLLLVVLFTPERPGLLQVDVITKYQEYFSNLMRHYMAWRYGPAQATCLFSKLLTKISDLRELSDCHNQYHLRLAKQEVDEIQLQLGNLNLNPYPEWNVVSDAQTSSSSQSQSTAALEEEQQQQHPHSHPQWAPAEPLQQHPAYSMVSVASSSSASTSPSVSSRPHSEENFGLQFMHAMQRSLTQILGTPHFGYEWVTPTMELGPFPGYEPYRTSWAVEQAPQSTGQHPGAYPAEGVPEAAAAAVAVAPEPQTFKQDELSAEQLAEFREALEEFMDNEHDGSVLKDDVFLLEEIAGKPAVTIKQEPATLSPVAEVDSPVLGFSDASEEYNLSHLVDTPYSSR